jgi:CBS domain-containing protein
MTTTTANDSPCLSLRAKTARDLMTPSPVSIRDTATVAEALALLIHKGVRAAPVIDAAGNPVGVLSQTDLLAHNRNRPIYQTAVPDAEGIHTSYVRDLMTPAVFSISPDAPAAKVVEELVALNVHRLFIVDRNGVLVGVVTARDVLRRLAP